MKSLIPKILAWLFCCLCAILAIIACWTAESWTLAAKFIATAVVMAVLSIIFAAAADS